MNTYLTPAILLTLCCCALPGIVAIVYAAQASGKLSAGDREGAAKLAGQAHTWCWVSFVLGAVAAVIALLAELSK